MSFIPPVTHGGRPVTTSVSIAPPSNTPERDDLPFISTSKVEKHLGESVYLSDREITLQLMASGILPTPEEAKEQFWALGEDWWKQIIDGCYQQLGPMVFDQNLHNGYGAEPGYFRGICKASHYFADRFHEELTFDLYRGMHHEACSHFRGKSNATVCDVSEIDSVRSSTGSTDFKYNLFHIYQHDQFPYVSDKIERSKQMEKYGQMLLNEIDTITGRFEEGFNDFEILEEENELVFNLYYLLTDTPLEQTAQDLFREFNIVLSSLRRETYYKRGNCDTQTLRNEYQKSAFNLISKLYAELEWLHPWIDGQGRTDLILLNGLLCREGMHPSILDYPYYSTFRSLENWQEYLKLGLIKFEQVAAEKGLLKTQKSSEGKQENK